LHGRWASPALESLKTAQRLAQSALEAPTAAASARMVHEAFDVAAQCGEPYHAAMAATWPLKVLRIHGRTTQLAARTDELLGSLGEIDCVARLWVLSYAIGSVCGGPKDVFVKVVSWFISEARACRSWRTVRRIYFVIGVVDAVDPDLSAAMLDVFSSPVARARAERCLAKYRAVPTTVDHYWWPNF